uniref:Amino acid transporter n=1 Tax=Meloidogyne javanica TaxID=6303 RepID=A0A915N9J6_MELJA
MSLRLDSEETKPVYQSPITQKDGFDDEGGKDDVALKPKIRLFGGVMVIVGYLLSVGCFIRESGGDYAYVLAAFGPLCGFLRMWIECIIVRVKFVTKIQNIFTIAKLGALTLIIITGLVLLLYGDPYRDSFTRAFEIPEGIGAGQIAIAFYSGLWAYNGWNYLNFITEEMVNPVRDLPLAILISCSLSTLFYVLANVAFYAGTSPEELLTSNAIAVTFANKFYGIFAFIMPLLVAGSCFGTVNGVMLTSSRLFFVAGRNEHMPSILSFINPYWNTPVPAVLFTAILSLAYLLLSDNIYTLINYVQIVNWLAIGVATAGLMWMRISKPPRDYPRPLKVNMFFPIIFLLGCIFLVVFPMYQAPMDTAIGIGIMLTGLPVYFLFVYWRDRMETLSRLMDDFTLFSQKLLLVIPPAKKEN